jgi:molybdopterin synthase catalytic subunit
MLVRVLFFGGLREALGTKESAEELAEGATVAVLRESLADRAPQMRALEGRLRIAVNQEFAEDDAMLRDGDEVALLPPVSGGMGACSLSQHPLDENAVTARVAGPDCGGVVTFVGAVRDSSRGHDIRHLEYEAYPEMALREMERIVDEASGRWPGSAAAAPHRAEAFAACRYAIDTLKERVPIWKKEVATDGAYWVDDHA